MPSAAVAWTVVAPGTARIGGVVSTTLTLNVVVPVVPNVSVALHVTVVDPRGNVLRGGGAHVTVAIGSPLPSVAVGGA